MNYEAYVEGSLRAVNLCKHIDLDLGLELPYSYYFGPFTEKTITALATKHKPLAVRYE